MNAHECYQTLRTVNLKEVMNMTPEQVIAKAQEAHLGKKTAEKLNETQLNFGTTFLIATKVAHACTEEQFEEFFNTGELPSLKLSKREMEVLRGGSLGGWLKRNAGWVVAGGLAVAGGIMAKKYFDTKKNLAMSDEQREKLVGTTLSAWDELEAKDRVIGILTGNMPKITVPKPGLATTLK